MGTRWAQGTGASWRLGIEGCCCAAAPPPSPRVSWASPRGVPWWPGVCQPLGGAAQGLERAEQGLAGDLRQPLGPTLWFLPSVLPCLPQCSQGPPPHPGWRAHLTPLTPSSLRLPCKFPPHPPRRPSVYRARDRRRGVAGGGKETKKWVTSASSQPSCQDPCHHPLQPVLNIP